jgi:glycosyltransferase involved in cell wall biosynthesis
MPTGVDRAELAYLRHLAGCAEPLFAIVRSTLGYVLLAPDGVAEIIRRLGGETPWGAADRLSVLARRKSFTVRRAESDLRRLARDRCRPPGLAAMLARHLPGGVAYLNIGHSNLSDRMLAAVRQGAEGRVAVMLHDVIPLDFPQYQRAGTPEKFAAMLRRVRAGADLVIYNSHDTRARTERYMAQWGDCPPALVAHLGVPVPVVADLPPGLAPARPYFVALGTIEPRKGHDLLLDLWQDMAADMAGKDIPGLLICGARGWNNAALFARLDRLPSRGPVRELPGLDDGVIAALLIGADGLLFPSRAEGYGLPPVEAAALGVPVVCCDLPVYREVLRDIPVYAKETDRYQWRYIIKSLTKGRNEKRAEVSTGDFCPPSWQDHFNAVLRFT